MVRLRTVDGQSRRQAAHVLGFSPAWVRTWWRRYRTGGEAALQPPRPAAPGPLATFPPAVAEAVVAYRRAHPRLGARRAGAALRQDPALAGQPVSTARPSMPPPSAARPPSPPPAATPQRT